LFTGSAIFNILIIIGATVLATGNTLQLDWKPVTRDCFFYAAAIAGIVGTFAGGRIDWWEGLIYVLFYGCYIVSMVYNQRLMKWMDSWKTVESFGSFKKNFSFSKRPPGHFQHGGAAEMKEMTTLSTIPDGDENLSEEQIELKVVKGKVKLEVTPPTSPTKSPLDRVRGYRPRQGQGGLGQASQNRRHRTQIRRRGSRRQGQVEGQGHLTQRGRRERRRARVPA
jgi:Ca2+/Na+ antiporter